MQIRINPAFHLYAHEAALVGRLLSAFGELEFTVLDNARRATDNSRLPFLRAMYRLRATSARLQSADAFMQPVCNQFDLGNEYEITKRPSITVARSGTSFPIAIGRTTQIFRTADYSLLILRRRLRM
jgi:hypothetical protein